MTRPRVFCDFNKRVGQSIYGLNTVGTSQDLERLELQLAPGVAVTVYDYDEFEDGRPAWMLADGVVVHVPGRGLAVEVDDATFRWEAREESSDSAPRLRPAV